MSRPPGGNQKRDRRKSPHRRGGRSPRRDHDQAGRRHDMEQASGTSQSEEPSSDYQLLLMPAFSAMTRITDHLFLTGVGGMTRENFRRNHIDFVVNITTEAPLWNNVECLRVPLEDDNSTNILAHLDQIVDRINEVIIKRNAHVLVHCVAGVSRSATVVIAYLMKYRQMSLRSAFGYCYRLRPVIRPNNGFMVQLINYELQLYGRVSAQMVEIENEGVIINVPDFFVDQYPTLITLETLRVREQIRQRDLGSVSVQSTSTRASSNLDDN